jgi:hypothetical protein
VRIALHARDRATNPARRVPGIIAGITLPRRATRTAGARTAGARTTGARTTGAYITVATPAGARP